MRNINFAKPGFASSELLLRISVWLLFLFFTFVQTRHLTTVPGLVGDEGYEGLSIVDHLRDTKPFIIGRESYVAFWSDYARLPFVAWFGETTLAMRLPMVIASCATFWLAYFFLRRVVNIQQTFFILASCFFSPPFILYQRISWPINFLPFFAFLFLFIITCDFRNKTVIAGLIAGLGVSTHVTFAAPLIGIVGAYALGQRKQFKNILAWWPAIIGFIAGFGLQVAIMWQMSVESARVGHISLIFERISILYPTLFNYFSGITYFGEYVGDYSHNVARLIVFLLLFFVLCALVLKPQRKTALYFLIAIFISTTATVFMVSYFRTRYFHVTTLGVCALAGLGFSKLFSLITTKKRILIPCAFILAGALSFWTFYAVFTSYLKTGGTTKNFQDSGNSWDKSGHFADIQPLADCIKKIGIVYAQEPKISNRLKFLREMDHHIRITDQRINAPWFIDYRDPNKLDEPSEIRPGEACPTVRNFIVIPNSDYLPPKKIIPQKS